MLPRSNGNRCCLSADGQCETSGCVHSAVISIVLKKSCTAVTLGQKTSAQICNMPVSVRDGRCEARRYEHGHFGYATSKNHIAMGFRVSLERRHHSTARHDRHQRPLCSSVSVRSGCRNVLKPSPYRPLCLNMGNQFAAPPSIIIFRSYNYIRTYLRYDLKVHYIGIHGWI